MRADSARMSSLAAVKESAGPIRVSMGIRALFGVLMVIGVATFLIERAADPTGTFAAFLLSYWFFLSLGLGGVFFIAVHYSTGSTWSVVVRRVAEGFSSYLPFALVLFLVILYGIPHLYVWSVPSAGAEHGVDITKGGYLSTARFTLRSAFFLVLWCLFAWFFRRNSIRQDQTGGPALSKANTNMSAFFFVAFAITFTLFSFDQLMSLEPTWYSTMFGVYMWAGLWQSSLAAITIVVILLRRQGALAGVVNRAHYWDLGKYMFAFSIFWMYIAFSQFMLIWYANLPEEIDWMIKRTFTSWGAIGVALMVFKFAIPFFALMHQRAKESEAVLMTIAGIILIGQWLDLYWVILPAFSPAGVVFSWTQIGMFLGFLGLFGWTLIRFFSRHPVTPVGDPFFEPSLRFHS